MLSEDISKNITKSPASTSMNCEAKSLPPTASIARNARSSKPRKKAATWPNYARSSLSSPRAFPRCCRKPRSPKAVAEILPIDAKEEKEAEMNSWGILGVIGLDRWLIPIDNATRSPFMPYGISGIMLGAAIVFFAFIGFDSISTQAEEAKTPTRLAHRDSSFPRRLHAALHYRFGRDNGHGAVSRVQHDALLRQRLSRNRRTQRG